ncbi:MAG: ABC transporter permease [Oenococcus sp.]|uniref:ABC transporter permease n=1 Tax=Oenococcus sp. TaxID=1979414 RepID=UPI0039E7C925
MQRLKKFGYLNIISSAVLIIITLLAIFAPLITKSPYAMNPINRLAAPSASHIFGTDNMGRDLFSRVIYAGRISLIIGLSVSVISTLLGVLIGLLAGYFPKLDAIVMRIIDGIMAFPALLLALGLVAALGGSIFNIIIAITIAYTPVMTRIVRSSTLQVKKTDYVLAARSMGASTPSILARDILPNIVSPIFVQLTFTFAEAILLEAALSFLGVGINPPTPTWGNILGDSRLYIEMSPWFSIFPGLAIVLTVLALNVLGDGLREFLDPNNA